MVSLRKKQQSVLVAFFVSVLVALSCVLGALPTQARASAYNAVYVNPDFEDNVIQIRLLQPEWKAQAYGGVTGFKVLSVPPVLEDVIDADKLDYTWYLYDADDIKVFSDLHPEMLPGGIYEARMKLPMKKELFEKEWAYTIMSENAPKVDTVFVNGNQHVIEYIPEDESEDGIPYFKIVAKYKVPGDPVGKGMWYYKQYGLDIGKRTFRLDHESTGFVWPIFGDVETGPDVRAHTYFLQQTLRRNHNTLSAPQADRYDKWHVMRSDGFAVTERSHLENTTLTQPDRKTIRDLNAGYHVKYLKDSSDYYLIRDFNSRQVTTSYEPIGKVQRTKYERDTHSYSRNRMIFKGWAIPQPGYNWLSNNLEGGAPPTAAVDNFTGASDIFMSCENPYGKAHWDFPYKDHGGKKMTVNFDSRGGSAVSPMQLKSTDKFIQAGGLPTPTKTNFTFKYWKGGKGPYAKIVQDTDAPGYNDDREITLYAEWEPSGAPAKVTYKLPASLGDEVIAQYDMKVGSLAGEPPYANPRFYNDFMIPGVGPHYIAGWEYTEGFEAAGHDYMVADKAATATAIVKPQSKITLTYPGTGTPDDVLYAIPGESLYLPPGDLGMPFINYFFNEWKHDGKVWNYPDDKVKDTDMVFEADYKLTGYHVEIKLENPNSDPVALFWSKDTYDVDDQVMQLTPRKSGKVLTHWDLYHDKNHDGTLEASEKAGEILPSKMDSDLYDQDYGLVFVAQFEEATGSSVVTYKLFPRDMDQVYNKGTELGDDMPEDPEKDGYTFTGWFDENGNPITPTLILEADTYTAVPTFEPKPVTQHTIEFYDKDGALIETVEAASDKTVTPPVMLDLEGTPRLLFKGWFVKDATPEQEADFTKTVGSVLGSTPTPEVLKVQAAFLPPFGDNDAIEIAFDTDGGTYVPNFNPTDATTMETPTFKLSDYPLALQTTKPGYVLTGYKVQEGKDELPADTPDKTIEVPRSIILVAQWEKDSSLPAEVTVTFKPHNGQPESSVTIPAGQTIEFPAAEKTGHTLFGWFNAEDHVKWNTADPVFADMTLEARWTPVEPLTVTYDVDGGTPAIADEQVQSGSLAPIPASPAKENFVFKGWINTEDGTLWDFSTPVVQNLALKAQWTKGIAGQELVTVTFDTQGGTPELAPLDLPLGNNVPYPQTITKDGMFFGGWYHGEEPWDFANGMVTEDITLTAHWLTEDPTDDTTYVRDDIAKKEEQEKYDNPELGPEDIITHDEEVPAGEGDEYDYNEGTESPDYGTHDAPVTYLIPKTSDTSGAATLALLSGAVGISLLLAGLLTRKTSAS